MAKWTKKKVTPEEINNGNEYTVNDNLSVESINAILNNSFKAQEDSERALELAEGANKANGTVVEINGEPQGTWDATAISKITNSEADFLKDKFNKQTNLFNPYDVKQGSSVENVNNRVHAIITKVKSGETYTISAYPTNNIRYSIGYKESANQTKDIINESGWQTSDSYSITATQDSYLFVNFSYYDDYQIYPANIINEGVWQIEKEGVSTPYQPYNSSSHITNGQADFLKKQTEKQLNIANITQLLEQPQGMNCSASKNHIIIRGTGTKNFGIEFGDTVKLKPNTTYTAKIFNQVGIMHDVIYLWDYDKAKSYSGPSLSVLNSHYTFTTPEEVGNNIKLDVYYEVEQGNVDIEFDYMLVEGPDIPEEFETYQGGKFVQTGDIAPIKVWGNTQPNIEFASQTASFSESVLDASLVRIDVRRNTSSYAGTLSFFVKPDVLGGSIPLSVSFVEGGTEYRPSRTCAFYNHAGLYFDNGYLGTAQNNAQMIPVAIYKYKY